MQKFFLCFLSLILLMQFSTAQYRMRIEVVSQPATHPHDTLFLAGNFNGWNPGLKQYALKASSGLYWFEQSGLPAGMYTFKFTRGSWQYVEADEKGAAISNRMIDLRSDTVVRLKIRGWVDDFPSISRVSTRSRNVFISDTAFYIPQINRTRRIWVYLPEAYARSQRSYPVLYMQDGQNLFDESTSAYGEWGVDELLDSLPENRQLIVVGIDHGGEKRLTEYNPWDSRFGKGEGAAYADFLVHCLKPYIDSNYRTKPERRNTAIAGSSMGGLISFYAALKYPRIYGAAGIFSPAFWIAPELGSSVDSLSGYGQNAFYFTAGEHESTTMVSDMRQVYDAMRLRTKASMLYTTIPEGKHHEPFWRMRMPYFLHWLYKLKQGR